MTLVTTAYAQKHGLNVSAGSLENPSNVSTLVAQTANTGVQWVIIYVYWSWAEPFESTDGADWTAWGPQVQRLHGYRTASLDLKFRAFKVGALT